MLRLIKGKVITEEVEETEESVGIRASLEEIACDISPGDTAESVSISDQTESSEEFRDEWERN